MFGTGNIGFVNNTVTTPASVVPVTGANNGLSIAATLAQLGQSIGAAGNPGRLLNNREIPLNGFSLNVFGPGVSMSIDDVNNTFIVDDGLGNPLIQILNNSGYYSFGDDFGIGNGNELFIQDGINRITLATSIGGSAFRSALTVLGDPNNIFQFGDCGNNQNGTKLSIDDNTQNADIELGIGIIGLRVNPASGLIINNVNFLMSNLSSWTDGAAAAVGTLTNAPAAGNPTKWIAVNDNGTTRFIPAW